MKQLLISPLVWAHVHDDFVGKFQNPLYLFHGIVVRSNDIIFIEIGPDMIVKKCRCNFIVKPFHCGERIIFSQEQHQNCFERTFVLEEWHDLIPDIWKFNHLIWIGKAKHVVQPDKIITFDQWTHTNVRSLRETWKMFKEMLTTPFSLMKITNSTYHKSIWFVLPK